MSTLPNIPAMACMNEAGLFRPLTDAEKKTALALNAQDGKQGEVWEPITPAPSVPESPRGATALWVYRDAERRPLYARFRKEDEGGNKVVLPLTYGRRIWTDRNGTRRDVTGWHWKQPARPLPLYGLDQLAANPEATVLLVEGEKTAEAASYLFPDLVVLTSGGSTSVSSADWSPLAGRRVTIWPDNDAPGVKYADAAIEALRNAGVQSVHMVKVPEGLPDGWDLADDLPLDMTQGGETPGIEILRPLVDQAPLAESNVKMPPGYSMTSKGLYFTSEATGELPPVPVWVSAPFEVIA